MTSQRKNFLLFVSTFLFANLTVFAEENVFSIETIKVCNFTLAYNDKGSGGDKDVSIYMPKVPNGYFMLGGYAQGDYRQANQCIVAARPAFPDVSDQPELLVEPANWKLVWVDKGSGANRDGSVWHPVSPDNNYSCVGSVGQAGYNKPSIPNYRCLHKCLLENVNVAEHLWSDAGTGANHRISMYTLTNSGMFFAVPERKKPFTLIDLKNNPACNSTLDYVLNAPAGNYQSTQGQQPANLQKKKGKEWINPDKVESDAPEQNKSNEWINPDDL